MDGVPLLAGPIWVMSIATAILVLKPWRDTHVQLEGPAVKGTQVSFLEDWYWATGEVPAMNWHPETMPNDQQVLVLAERARLICWTPVS